MTKTQTRWSGLVREWKQSGKTLREFAEGKPIKPSTLRWWSTRLRQLKSESKESESTRPAVRMVAVRTTRTLPSPEAMPAYLFVEVGGARIGVRDGFDAVLLRRLVAALREGGR